MTNGGGQIDQIKPSCLEIDRIDCHFSPQAQINRYRLQLRSLGLPALAARVKLLQGTFDVRGQIGGGTEISLAFLKIPED